MYCVKCGVELQKGTEECPLCGLRVWHPDLQEKAEPAPYPRFSEAEKVSHGGALFIVSFAFLIPLIVCLLADWRINGAVTWSGYVLGGLVAGYVSVCLPMWFRNPDPVIFYPTASAAFLLLALYVALKTGGRWFLSFAFPVWGILVLITESVIVLARHAVRDKRHRLLYIFGGAFIALGMTCVGIEFLLQVTFGIGMIGWSLYPLSALFLLGIMLIVIGICPSLRTSLYKKFFI